MELPGERPKMIAAGVFDLLAKLPDRLDQMHAVQPNGFEFAAGEDESDQVRCVKIEFDQCFIRRQQLLDFDGWQRRNTDQRGQLWRFLAELFSRFAGDGARLLLLAVGALGPECGLSRIGFCQQFTNSGWVPAIDGEILFFGQHVDERTRFRAFNVFEGGNDLLVSEQR